MKKCPRCKDSKDESLFYKNTRTISGLSCYCKKCMVGYRREKDELKNGRKSDPRRMNNFKPLEERFRMNISVDENGCWIWCGSTAGTAGIKYGVIMHKKKLLAAHRLSWEMKNGKIPEGALICHKCDVPLCVNPDHLFTGSHQDNANDMVSKGRQTNGSRHPNSKLTEMAVKMIRGRSMSDLEFSRMFGVSENCVWEARIGKTWKHIPTGEDHGF